MRRAAALLALLATAAPGQEGSLPPGEAVRCITLSTHRVEPHLAYRGSPRLGPEPWASRTGDAGAGPVQEARMAAAVVATKSPAPETTGDGRH